MANDYLTSISYSQALKIILAEAQQQFIPQVENVELLNCVNRVLAECVTAQVNVPAFHNSAMDGYAIRYSDLPEKQGWLDLQEPQYAGVAGNVVLGENCAIPIMTGAAIPEGADTVVVKENSQVKDAQVHLREIGEKGGCIRNTGADIKSGSVIAEQALRLKSQDLGLISSVGCGELKV